MVMHVELQATCSALGYQEGDKYVKEPDCLETVKDLIRFLKREDDTLDIRRQLGHTQILQNDLIPILKQYNSDTNLFETVLRLMVNLTQPTVLCFGSKLPDDKTMRNYALEIDAHLQSYKETFVDEELFGVLSAKIGGILKLDWEHRQEEDKLLLERLLILIRNVLHIPPNPQIEQRTDDDASIHDQILWVMHVSGLEDMLLYIASSDEERQLCMHMLEIISLMFREQTPEILASAGVQRSQNEKEKDERELEIVRLKELKEKKMNMLKHNTRHSRFGGTYVVLNMKSIGDKDLIYHKSQGDVQSLSLDLNKKYRKKAKNLAPIKETEVHRRSTLSIRLCLKEFIVQFLENCYNPLMFAVKDNLQRERTQDHDETYYLWVMRFFMEFCRLHSKRVDLVSETLSVPTFHYIYNNLLTYYEMIMSEKKEAVTWSKRVHLALKAYQELLLTLDMMDRSRNPQLMESSKVIKSNIFYMMEFRDIFVTLLKRFNEAKQSRSYLKDLVESTHLFLKMLEHHSRQTHLVVQRKTVRRKKKKPKANNNQSTEPTEQQLEDLWDEISDELSSLVQGLSEVPSDISPFDAASEVEDDQQRAEAMIKIQDALRALRVGEGVAVLRAAREVWPERNDFGAPDIGPEDEFMALREIFMTNLPRPRSETGAPNEMEEELSEHEVEEEEMEAVSTTEQSFDFKTFLHDFARGDILKGYGLLLADFEKNSTHTNHCILKMLHRIAVELGYPAMIFQASIFRVFQKIIIVPYAKMSQYQELVKFAMYIIRRFIEVAEKNQKIFMEMLFWKGKKESLEITDGYGSYSSKVKNTWTEDQEEELLRLFEMFGDNENPEKDTVDLIMERFTDPTKKRGQIISELKRLNLITSAKDLRKKKTSAKTWTEEEEFELADLYETHKNSDDPVGNILLELSTKRSKNKVIEKLLSAGLVQDRSKLYKKRRSSKKKGSDDDDDDDGDDVADGYDEGDGFIVREDVNEPEHNNQDGDDDLHSSDDDSSEESDIQREVTPASPASAADCIRDLVKKGYTEQIGWIQSKLRRIADIREQSGELIPVPIVPVTEENENAMDDSVFTGFLQQIGLAPPSNEQEVFWRIPGNLTASDLRNIADRLELNTDGEPTAADKLTLQPKKQTKRKKAKKSENDSKKTKKTTKNDEKKDRKEKESKKQKAADRKKMLQDLLKKRKEGKRKRRRSGSDRVRKQQKLSESDDDENPLSVILSGNMKEAMKSNQLDSAKKGKTARLKRPIESDSDSSPLEDENALPIVENVMMVSDQSESRENSQSELQKNSPPVRVKRVIDSDSEGLSESDDDETPLSVILSGNMKEAMESDKLDSAKKGKTARLKRPIESDSDSSPLEDENALPIVENEMMVSDQSESRENSQSELQKNSPPVRVKRVIDSDSEGLSESDDDETPLSVILNVNMKEAMESAKLNSAKKVKTARLKRPIESDSDSSPLEDENALPIVENEMIVSDQSESKENSQSELQKNSPPVRVKRVIDSDSEGLSSEDEDQTAVVENKSLNLSSVSNQSESRKSSTAGRLKRIIDSDSDSDDDRLVVDEDQISSQPLSKRQKLSDSENKNSEGTFPATMLSQLRDDSDSDVDDHVPLRRALHKNCIQSDDDDE